MLSGASRWRFRMLPVGLLALGACKADTLPAKGQLMLVISSDMSPPEDFDSVLVEITRAGEADPRHSLRYDYGEEPSFRLPATLAIVAGDSPQPVSIRVVAELRGEPLVTRDAITTVPTDRSALLRIGLSYLCKAEPSRGGAIPGIGCDESETCDGGRCVPVAVDAGGLPPYRDGDVFGGGTPGKGACFDTAACFATASPAPEADEDCSLDAAALGDVSRLNLALETSDGGVCVREGVCYVPIDRDARTGWFQRGSRILLPQAACAPGRTVVSSSSCASKTPSVPTCGPWSSVGTNTPGNGGAVGLPPGGGGTAGGGPGAGGTGGEAPTSGGANTGGTAGTPSGGSAGRPSGGGAGLPSAGSAGAGNPTREHWLRTHGGSADDRGRSLDQRGDALLVSGSYFSRIVDFGSGRLPSPGAGETGIFVVRAAVDGGAVNWSRGFVGNTKQMISDGDEDRTQVHVAADADGNALLAASFHGSVAFDAETVTNSAGDRRFGDVVVAKLAAADGATEWTSKMASTGNDVPTDIATDADGNVIVTGWFDGSLTLGTQMFMVPGRYNHFITKFAGSSGRPLWTTALATQNAEANSGGRDVVAANDAIYAVGNFQGSVAFGSVTEQAGLDGQPDAYVLRLDPESGELVAHTVWPGLGRNEAQAVAVGPSGELAVAGYLDDGATMGSTELQSRGLRDWFVALLDPVTLEVVWVSQLGGAQDDVAYGVGFVGRDVVAVGHAASSLVLVGEAAPAKGLQDVLLAKFAGRDGRLLWGARYGSPGGRAAANRLVSDGMRLFFTGEFDQIIDLPPSAAASAGAFDLFFAEHAVP